MPASVSCRYCLCLFISIEICEAEERLKALIMERTADSAQLTSLVNGLQQQVAHTHLDTPTWRVCVQ